MLLAPTALNQQLVYADETELQQSSNQSDAETINKQQNKPNQNSDKDKSTDDKTAANDTNNKKPTADNKSSNANKQSSHNKQINSALDTKQTGNSAANNTLSNDASSSSNTASTTSVNKIRQNNNADKANKPRVKAKAFSKKIQKHHQTDDADLDLYLSKPGYTNSIRSQKQQNTKPAVLSKKVIYHRSFTNSDNHQALPQASESLLPVLPNTGFKKSVWQHDNHPITLKSAALGLSACIIFLAAISIPSKRY